MKRKKILLFIAIALPLIGFMLFVYKSVKLENQLLHIEEEKMEVAKKLEDFERLAKIDSLLFHGDYQTAITSYGESMETTNENKLAIPLRIALAERLMQENTYKPSKLDSALIDEDSLRTSLLAGSVSLRKFDSLSFSLEKTKVQLDRVKKQLQQKSFGEYLTFKSKKGNQLHYIGEVKNGKANGYGIALLETGSRYEGNWKNNERHGDGTFYWPDGEYYSGDYQDDLRNGFGTYFWPNGEKYTGQWKRDKRSGTGKFFDSEGDVVASGEWNEDKLVEINER